MGTNFGIASTVPFDDLAGNASRAERAIYDKLDEEIQIEFKEDDTLGAVIETFRDKNIPIVLELEEDGDVNAESPIGRKFAGKVSVRSALRILLKPLELTYVIQNEVMTITSKDDAKTRTTRSTLSAIW